MASAYSKPKNFDNYVQPINTELVNFVLGSKQQKFDYNVAKVEQTLAQFGNLGLVRDDHKQYLADRINSTIDSLGDLSRVDWSDSNIERQITTSLKGAIDDKVVNDIKYSRSYTNYMNTVQDIRENDPEKYSDINFQMGLIQSGAADWAQGKTESFGNLSYTPYQNVIKEMNQVIQDYVKTHGTEKVIAIPNGDGTFIKKTIKGLDKETIRSLWKANMTPEMQKQLQMEAEYIYGRGNVSERGQAMMVDSYENSMLAERSELEQNIDLLGTEIKGAKGEKKEILQGKLAILENRRENLDSVLSEPISYEQAYLDGYFKEKREDIVNANNSERLTDIEIDYSELKALNERRKLLQSTEEEQKMESGSYFGISSNPFIPKDKQAQNVYEKTEKGIQTAVANFRNGMLQKSDEEFFDATNMTKEKFNAKSQEEQLEIVGTIMQGLAEDGISLNADRGYTDEEINAYGSYRANKAVFEEVNTKVQSTANDVAMKSYEAMIDGVKRGAIDPSQMQNPHIRKAIASGKKFGELSSDMKNAFRAAMIDESFRRSDIPEGLRPYLIKQRDEYIDGIQDASIKNQFAKSEDVEAGYWEVVAEGLWETVKGSFKSHPFNLLRDKGAGAVEAFTRAKELRNEADRRDSFGEDSNLSELDNKLFNEPDFIVDGEPVKADDYIESRYEGINEEVNLTAQQASKKLSSTASLLINRDIEGQEEIYSRLANRLEADNPNLSMSDFDDGGIYLSYDPSDNTVTLNAKLDISAAKTYERENDRVISSQKIPLDELNDIQGLTNRFKKIETEWAYNSDNKYAQDLTFTTTGFADTEERKKAVNNVIGRLGDEELGLRLRQDPDSIGLTKSEMAVYMDKSSRETEDGNRITFKQEFPRVYELFTTNKGEFNITYESKQGQGYFMTVDYKVGKKTHNLLNSRFTQRKELNPTQAYIEAYQAQTEEFAKLINGYRLGDDKTLATLREIQNG